MTIDLVFLAAYVKKQLLDIKMLNFEEPARTHVTFLIMNPFLQPLLICLEAISLSA